MFHYDYCYFYFFLSLSLSSSLSRCYSNKTRLCTPARFHVPLGRVRAHAEAKVETGTAPLYLLLLLKQRRSARPTFERKLRCQTQISLLGPRKLLSHVFKYRRAVPLRFFFLKESLVKGARPGGREMTSEYTRLKSRDGQGSNRGARSCLGTCRTWYRGKSSSCVSLVVVLGCLTVLGILLAIAVLRRPPQPRDNGTLPGGSGDSAADQWR